MRFFNLFVGARDTDPHAHLSVEELCALVASRVETEPPLVREPRTRGVLLPYGGREHVCPTRHERRALMREVAP